MQLGFVSAIVPELSLEEVAALASSTGYGCVEVMCWPPGKAERRYAGVTHIDVVGFDKDDAAQVIDLMQRYNVSISGLGYYPDPLAPDETEAQIYVAHIRAVIRAAELLGVGVVNTFVGHDWTKSLEENSQRFLGHLEAVDCLRRGSRCEEIGSRTVRCSSSHNMAGW